MPIASVAISTSASPPLNRAASVRRTCGLKEP
jgi:hypothetical protein